MSHHGQRSVFTLGSRTVVEGASPQKGALRILLQRRRAELNPHDFGLTRIAPQGRRAAGGGLSQTQVDDLCGLGRGTMEKLENGRYGDRAPEHVLNSVGELLNLDTHEWELLWLLTRGHQPAYPRPCREDEIPASWLRVIDSIPHPVYITTHRWEVVAYNPLFPRIFPGRRIPDNTMAWMLLSFEARHVLTDWATAWAPFVAPQLRAGRAAYPDDAYITDLERRVIADPEAGPIYQDFGCIYVHPDGACRPFHHPEHGPGWCTLHTSSPKSSPRFITMTMLFDKERPPVLPPLRVPHGGT